MHKIHIVLPQTVHAEDTAAEQGQTPEKKSGTVTLEKKNDGTYVFGNEYLKRTFSLSADKVLSTKEITNYRTGTPTVFTPQAGSEEFIINTLDNNSEGEDSGFVAPKKKLETTGWKATADSVAENEAPNGGTEAGSVKIGEGTKIVYKDAAFKAAAEALAADYKAEYGVDLQVADSGEDAGDIVFTKDDKNGLGEEGYIMEMDDKVNVKAELK